MTRHGLMLSKVSRAGLRGTNRFVPVCDIDLETRVLAPERHPSASPFDRYPRRQKPGSIPPGAGHRAVRHDRRPKTP